MDKETTDAIVNNLLKLTSITDELVKTRDNINQSLSAIHKRLDSLESNIDITNNALAETRGFLREYGRREVGARQNSEPSTQFDLALWSTLSRMEGGPYSTANSATTPAYEDYLPEAGNNYTSD